MSTKIIVNGSYGSHEFNHRDPADTLRALRAEAEDKVKAAQRAVENAENSVIAANITLGNALEIRTRFDAAIAALQNQETPA